MKAINLTILGVMALLFAATFVSAAFTVSGSFPGSASFSQGSFTVPVTIANPGSSQINVSLSSLITNKVGSWSATMQPSTVTVENSTSSTPQIVINFPSNQTGSVAGTLHFNSSDGSSFPLSFSVPLSGKSLCSNGPVGSNLSIVSVDINNKGRGEDDEWMLLDEVSIEVEVENVGSTDMRDVNVQLYLIDNNGNDRAGNLDFTSDDDKRVSLGRLNTDDNEEAVFEFTIPGDVDLENYDLVFKAYNKNDGGESANCVETTGTNMQEDIEITGEDEEEQFLQFDNLILTPLEATCSDTVTLTADLLNLGDSDDDIFDNVRASLNNPELRIDQSIEIRQGVDAGESVPVSFTFTVPSNAQDKIYSLELSSEYDYRNGIYREASEEVERVNLRVFGCGGTSTPGTTSTITASSPSNVQAGKDVLVEFTLRNTDSKINTYTVDVVGYNSWATLNSVSQRTVTLEPGQSRDVTVDLTTNKDASGSQSLTISAISGSNQAIEEVTVDVQGNSLSSLFSGNATLWIVGIVNLVLIILIILVAVRISRR